MMGGAIFVSILTSNGFKESDFYGERHMKRHFSIDEINNYEELCELFEAGEIGTQDSRLYIANKFNGYRLDALYWHKSESELKDMLQQEISTLD